jgi:hypothetical protein
VRHDKLASLLALECGKLVGFAVDKLDVLFGEGVLVVAFTSVIVKGMRKGEIVATVPSTLTIGWIKPAVWAAGWE